jgi:hypothetical protein
VKKVVIVVILGLALGAAAPSAWRVARGWKAEGAARERLDRVLRSVREGDDQQAISAWARDLIVMDYDELQVQQPRFEEFWRRSGLATRSDWRIASVDADFEQGVVRAELASGGEHVWLIVAPGEPITVDEGD